MEISHSVIDALLATEKISDTCRGLLRAYQQQWQVSDCVAILETSVLSERQLAEGLHKVFSLPRVSQLSTVPLDPSILKRVPFEFAWAQGCLPVRFLQATPPIAEVIVAEPCLNVLQELQRLLGGQVNLLIGEYSELRRAIMLAYPIDSCLEVSEASKPFLS